MICPKCNHQRTDADDPSIPDYKCPACGIVYEKFRGNNNSNQIMFVSINKKTHPTYTSLKKINRWIIFSIAA